MILAVSRFKVSNGREADVKEAFLNRPHLVDTAQDFVEMATCHEVADTDEFFERHPTLGAGASVIFT